MFPVLRKMKIYFSRPDIVDIETYVYPGNPSYAGMGPRAIPEEWVRDDKVVHYLIPKTFVDWLTPKFGETGIYSLLTMGTLALASKVSLEKCNQGITRIYLGIPCFPH